MASDRDTKPFDSSSNVSYIHQDKKGGQPPSGGDELEIRVSALEATSKRIEDKLDKIIDKVSKVEIDVARLDGKVSTLPTTLQLLGFVVAVLAIAGLSKYLAP